MLPMCCAAVTSLTASEENIPASLCSSLSKWKSMTMINRFAL